MELLCRPDGQVRSLYDELIDLAALGRLSIRRASYVEPDVAGKWSVDLSPAAGPRLGPYSRRSAALAAEQAWLETHRLGSRNHQ
ncbi:MAG TPA: hypothetical protein VGG64_09905 [Pirellulales bacterium]|jgi:hypothetical protein